jgi:low affinity Fe/Cu permease
VASPDDEGRTVMVVVMSMVLVVVISTVLVTSRLGVTVTYVFSVSVLVTVLLVQPCSATTNPTRGMMEKIADFILI